MTKLKVYFSGSIKGGRQLVENYHAMIELISSHATVLTEHIGQNDYKSLPNDRAKYIYDMDTSFIHECDLVIADITVPSLGVGYELAYAEKLNKPTYCLYNSEFANKISFMILGDDYFNCFSYDNLDQALKIINEIFDKGE